MWSRVRCVPLMGLMLVVACARLNPSFGEGEADAGTDGDSAGSTVGTTRGSVTDAASDTRDAESDSNSTSSETIGSMSETNPTAGEGTTEGASTDTLADTGSESGEVVPCSVIPGPTAFCNTVNQPCQGGTCAPWASELEGELEGTFCLPAGMLEEGEECQPVCTEELETRCGPGLVCDVYSGDGQCRRTCLDKPLLACDAGICLRYGWEDEDGTETATPLSLCKGECDPVAFDLTNTCEKGEVCVLDDAEGTVCVGEEAPVEFQGDCSENECGVGLICVPADLVPACEHEACCYEACSFAYPICPVGNCTVTLDVPFADEISVGFCPPPP